MGRREGVKQKKRKTNQAYPPTWRFQAIISLICGSPWFVWAILENHSGHVHSARGMLLIGVGLAFVNFLTNFNSHSFETALVLFIFSLTLCCILLPVFRKARDKATRTHSHRAAIYISPKALAIRTYPIARDGGHDDA